MNRHLRISISLALILMLTGATDTTKNSIAQTQLQPKKVTEIASNTVIAEKVEVKEVKDEWYIPEIKMDYEEQKFLYKLCEKADIPYNLMLAQIRCESNFDNSAVGSSGDTGYFQILKSWDKYLEQELNKKIDLKDSFDNLESGILLMRYNLLSAEEYNGKEKIVRALNAYNQGGQTSLNYARKNGWNAWHYGKRVYKTFQEYEKGNYSYDPYE